MSRSGYSDDCDGWALIRWRGAVSQAIRGKRGQAMLCEMMQALDSLPEPTLAAEALVTADGEYCALGALGRARAMDLEQIDPDDREAVAAAFGVAEALAAEIMDLNDDHFDEERIYYNFDVCGPMRRWETHRQLRWKINPQAGRIRWSRMRAWVASNIKEKP
jgi:predicted outer membrane lipoprotein